MENRVLDATHQPTLVGRDSERATLVELVRQVRRGGRVAVVEGEAGIGKTRLVEGALEAARAGDAAVLATKAEELEAHRPFGPIVDLAVGRWRERLQEQLAGMDVGVERQFGVAETVLGMLDNLCSRAPLVLGSRISTGPIPPLWA